MSSRGAVMCGLAAIIASGAVATTLPGQAWEPQTEGLVLGVYTAAVSTRADTPLASAETGFLIGGALGFGFTRRMLAFLGVDIGAAAEAGERKELRGDADLGVRFSPFPARRSVPYGEIAFSAWGKEQGDDRMLLGNAFTLGAGVDMFWVSYMSVDVGVRYSRGRFDEARVDGRRVPDFSPFRASATRIMVGIKRRPPRDR